MPPRIQPAVQSTEARAATRRYIDTHWTETFRHAHEDTADEIGLPHPHTVPSTDPSMWLFFYWDVYFTNLGLLRSGHVEQARHNADNILSLIERFGYVPNMTVRIALNRTQIPLSAVICRDVHAATGDDAWLARALPLLEHEYTFWMAQRLAPNGLNRAGTHADPHTIDAFAKVIAHRLRDLPDEPIARRRYLQHKLAECEVWDFTPRFDQRCMDFNPVDTNAALFHFEQTVAGFHAHLGHATAAARWQERAAARRELIDRYLWDETAGFYFDYDWVNRRRGPVVSSAAWFALWTGLCSEAQAARLVANLPLLERDHGLIACREGSNASANTFQWDAPNAWPPLQCAAIMGLQRYGYHAEAHRLAEKYVHTCARNFAATGQLWEKYNGVTGGIDVADEYRMPPMLGWTAGIFLYAEEVLASSQ